MQLKLTGDNVQGLSKAALGYNQAVKENKSLYNLLQELRGITWYSPFLAINVIIGIISGNSFSGNIRVFCRIRPLINSESISSIEHIGNDGSIMVCDPLKPQTTRKIFQFNKIFGPTTTQGNMGVNCTKRYQPLSVCFVFILFFFYRWGL